MRITAAVTEAKDVPDATREALGDRRRRAILAAARSLLEERPFDQVTVQMISNRAGITRSNFYHYFDSKCAVVGEFLATMVRELDWRTATSPTPPSDESPRRFVTRRLAAANATFDGHRWLLRLALALRHDDTEIQRMFEDRLRSVADDVLASLRPARRVSVARSHAQTVAQVRILAGATATVLSEDDPTGPALAALARMWLHGLGADTDPILASPATLRC